MRWLARGGFRCLPKGQDQINISAGESKEAAVTTLFFTHFRKKILHCLQQCKSRFKRCLVSNGGTNQLFCEHGERVTLNEEGKLAPGISNAFIFKDAIFASSNLSFKYLKSAFKVE